MKLLLSNPCEKVLQDPDSGHSLIAVFHDIKIQISKDAEAPPNDAVVPQNWAVFSKFGLDHEEENKEYSLLTDIFWPDGKPFVSGNQLNALPPTKNGMTFVVKLQGFPMGQNGEVKVRQTLKCNGAIVFGPFESIVRINVERTMN